MDAIIVIILLSILTLLAHYLIILLAKAGTLDKLHRSIYVADKKIKFLDTLEYLENGDRFYKGIDNYDVISEPKLARSSGLASLEKELKKEGNILEL